MAVKNGRPALLAQNGPFRPVIQLELTGCGIASAAAITGLSYAQAKRVAALLGIVAQDERLWSDTAHLRRLLKHLGMTTGRAEHPFRSWQTLPDLALLSIKWHREKGRPFWHWVVVRARRRRRARDRFEKKPAPSRQNGFRPHAAEVVHCGRCRPPQTKVVTRSSVCGAYLPPLTT